MLKSSSLSLCLSMGLLGTVLITGTLPSAGQQANRLPAAEGLNPSSGFSAGTFEEIDGEIVLRVKLNGTLGTRFVLDCASWTSLLSSKTIQVLNLKLETTGTGDSKLTQGKLTKLAIGGATLTEVSFSPDEDDFSASWNKEHPEATISGVLGQDFLEKHAIGLDFATHTYGFWIGGKLTAQDAENFNRVLCTPESDVIYYLRPGASQRVGKITLKNPVSPQ